MRVQVCKWPTIELRLDAPGRTLLGMRILLSSIVASLAIAAPAWGQATPEPVCFGTNDIGDPVACPAHGSGTVGDGQVVTDPGNQIDQGDGEGTMRGEVHVLSDTRESNVASHQSEARSPEQTGASVAQAQTAPRLQPVASIRPAHATRVKRVARNGGKKTLPFTGVDAWMLALGGLILLECGMRLRRVTRPPAAQSS